MLINLDAFENVVDFSSFFFFFKCWFVEVFLPVPKGISQWGKNVSLIL